MALLGDADVVGVGEDARVLTEQLLPREADHLAHRVVDVDDPILEVRKGHRGHVLLKGDPEPLGQQLEAMHVAIALGHVLAVHDDAPHEWVVQ